VGRFWIEALRIDDAHHILGLRLNDWTSILVFVGAVAFLLLRKPKPAADEPLVEVGGSDREHPAHEDTGR
jgi:prolipoprotein diacylglyceryltransferase